MSVCRSLCIQTEVESDKDGGELIPKFLFILSPIRGKQTGVDIISKMRTNLRKIMTAFLKLSQIIYDELVALLHFI